MIWHQLASETRETLLIVALHLCGAAIGLFIGWVHHG